MSKILAKREKGFTIIELLVSISIFAVVVTIGLALFSQVLRIQRRVETLRRLNQALRNTSEFMVKEVRNSKIHYGIEGGTALTADFPSNCPQPPQSGGVPSGGATYVWNNVNRNQGIALLNASDELECIYYNAAEKAIYIQKVGITSPQRLTPQDVSVDKFKVRVTPGRDPYMDTGGGLGETQPMAQFVITMSTTLGSGETRSISYQTSVSTNIYDIPRQ